jgi:hypothetical protein
MDPRDRMVFHSDHEKIQNGINILLGQKLPENEALNDIQIKLKEFKEEIDAAIKIHDQFHSSAFGAIARRDEIVEHLDKAKKILGAIKLYLNEFKNKPEEPKIYGLGLALVRIINEGSHILNDFYSVYDLFSKDSLMNLIPDEFYPPFKKEAEKLFKITKTDFKKPPSQASLHLLNQKKKNNPMK